MFVVLEETCLRKNACFFLPPGSDIFYQYRFLSHRFFFLQQTFYSYSVGLIDYYGMRALRFFFASFFFFFFLPSARVRHTTDMPRTKPSILYCEHVAGQYIVTYARLDLGAADPSNVRRRATSLVINEKQLYQIT